MHKLGQKIKKLATFVALLALLAQTFVPYLSVLPQVAYAQEADTVPNDLPTPTPEESLTPVESPIPTPTAEVVLSPTPTETATPAPTEIPEPSAQVDQSTNQSQPTINSTTAPTPSDTVAPSPAEEKAPVEKETDGNISFTILKNASASSLDLLTNLQATGIQSSASLSTDKLDYSPTDIALITGTQLLPSISYTLYISSTDPPAVNFSTKVTTNDQGSFVYAYQLDGKYRPNYKVELKDEAGNIVVSTTFTDSPVSGCSNDSAGVNDVPGQKDLTKMCADYSGLPTSVGVSWNWDEVSFNGSNTGDACALFDTNGNGNANYAVCVQVGGNPASYITKFVYSCDDSSATNCLGNVALSPSSGTTCSSSIAGTDPFPAGSGYPNDAVANCTVKLSDVGGSVASLTDVCSYPSASTPSNASDCILFKTNAGKLTVTKVLSPANDPGLFNLQVDGTTQASDIGNGGTTLTQEVSAGSHSVGETAGTATSLSNYSNSVVCKDAHGTGNIVSSSGTNPWTLSVANGQDILCTITNTRVNNGSITIVKDAQPNSSQSFGFTTTGGLTPSTFNLVDNGGANSTTYSNLASGNYSISENAVADWTLSNVSCTDNSTHQNVSTPISTGTGTIALSSGQNATCTFTNTRNTGTLRVFKNVDLNGDGDYIDANETGATDWKWQANAGADHNSGDSAITVNTGNYALTETSKTNFHQVGLSCTGGTLTGNSVAVTNGANVVCTFLNARDTGTIIIHKDVQGPAGQDVTDVSQSFGVKLDNGDSQSITDGGTVTINNVTTGTHTITEDAPPSGYTLYSITPDSDGGALGAQVSVILGQTTNVYVVNRQQNATITIHKDVINPDGADVSDTHSFTVQRDNSDSKTIAEGTDAVYSVAPGTYTFTENADSNYTLDSITGDSDANPANGAQITVGSNGSASLTFINKQKKATITVVKNVVNSDGQTEVSDNHTFEVTVDGVQKSFGEGNSTQFSVNPGTYSAVEQSETNYVLVSNDGPKTVGSNGSATITIVNKQNSGSISGTKFDENGNVLADWTINLFTCTGLGIGCSVSPLLSAITASDGLYTFDNLLTGFYKVSEVMQTGWTNVSSLFHDIVLNPGTISANNDFTNKGNLSIIACKYESLNGTRDSQTVPVDNWTFKIGDKVQNTGEESNCTTFTDLKPGTYVVSELPIPSGWAIADGSDGTKEVVLTSENETVNFYNYRNGQITGLKWNDANGDSRRCTFSEQNEESTCEQVLSGWTIFIDKNGNGTLDDDEVSTQTGIDGAYSFTDLKPGVYSICEVMQTGWEQTYPASSTESLCHSVVVVSGNVSSNNDFGNRSLTPVIEISKTNNKEGIDQAPGDSVVYTLTLTVDQGTANNVTVKDLLPSGFKYKSGSWTATLNGEPISIPEPVYHSPGTWQVGTMNPGDIVELSYVADIDSAQTPGIYKDVAWAQGTSQSLENVIALAQPTGFVDTNFVGTDVSVVKDQQNSASIAVNTTKAVLGASTQLPSTGADDMWAAIAAVMLIIGLALGSIGYILHKHYA